VSEDDSEILSPDGQDRWDGAAWQEVNAVIDAGPASPGAIDMTPSPEILLSPDGQHRWDGHAWQSVLPRAARATSADNVAPIGRHMSSMKRPHRPNLRSTRAKLAAVAVLIAIALSTFVVLQSKKPNPASASAPGHAEISQACDAFTQWTADAAAASDASASALPFPNLILTYAQSAASANSAYADLSNAFISYASYQQELATGALTTTNSDFAKQAGQNVADTLALTLTCIGLEPAKYGSQS
jgi:hypothetical protein